MKLASVRHGGTEVACIGVPGGWMPMDDINLLTLIRSGQISTLRDWDASGDGEILGKKSADILPPDQVEFAPLYRQPAKIWGIGLNYRDHAADLDETVPTGEPGSFMKPATTIIGYGDTIRIPPQSERTTAEAELGVIIGKECKDVPREDWLGVVAGFTTIIDMTAEDILRRNPRYLTLSKSFDTFFSFGPTLVTPDEVEDVRALNVATVINGRIHATNIVANMTFPPDFLVAFHSRVMTLLPGDVLSTGTPGATPIGDGDVVECHIDGFDPLVNPVVDLKATR